MSIAYRIIFSFFAIIALSACSDKIHPDVTKDEIAKSLINKNTPVGTIGWSFSKDEPIEITVLDVTSDANTSKVEANVKTEGRWSRLKMDGTLELDYKWVESAWVLNEVSNISFKPQGNEKLRLEESSSN